MITIKEMADMLGISTTTVSNVIHGKTGEVSEKTREQVEKLLEELDYVPNMNARNLAQNESKIIGISLKMRQDKYENWLKDPFMSEIIGAMEKVIRSNGYYMMLYISHDINKIAQHIATWNVDGLILLGMQNQDCLKVRQKYKKPVVLVDCYVDEGVVSYVNIGLEDEVGAYKIVRYLIENGHRKIAYISDNYEGVDYERYIGYKRAMEEFGLAVGAEDFYMLQPGEREFAQSLEDVYDMVDRYTAFFCASDYYAATILNFLKDRGKRIPEDISIVGFDDNIYSQFVRPALTTVHQSPTAKGEIAVEKLIEQLRGGKPDERRIRLPVRLTIRESARKINNKEI